MGDYRSLVLALAYKVFLKPDKLSILVIDDHGGMRDGICAVINAQPDMTVVGEASDGQEALQRFRALQPDVSLLDWNLPIVPGEEVLETVIKEHPSARIIVITSLSDDDCIRRAFCLGAGAYLHKDMLRRELIPAIRSVYQGQRYLSRETATRLQIDT